jgi:hypothetical protein
MLNNLTMPLTAATGGIIPPFCPLMPSAADLAQSGVAGAAAAGKKDALEAAARRANVRYLGTLDCRYFPDAAKALSAALRTDSSECVRYEAALVLNRGCCCTQLTINALEACVSGTEVDGSPAERSGRVRCAAATALEKCLSCYVFPAKEPEEVEPEKKETKPGEATPLTMPPTTKLAPGSRMPSPESVERARKTLQTFNEMLAFSKAPNPGTPAAKQSMALPAGQQTLFHILRVTAEEPAEPLKAHAVQPAVAQVPATKPTAMVAETPTVTNAKATTVTPAVTPTVTNAKATTVTPTMTPVTPVAMVDEAVIAPTMVMPPQLDTEPKAMPSVKVPEIKAPEIKLPEVKGPEVKVPALKMPETKAEEVKTANEPKEIPGKVIAIIPAKAVETAPKTTTVAAPTDKASEAVLELAKKVTQNTSVAERHAAIRQIVKYDWKKHPMVASALILGATSDKEPAVRVDCMRHMVAYKITHPQVITEMTALCNDSDVWVRQEAIQTLSLLKAMQ